MYADFILVHDLNGGEVVINVDHIVQMVPSDATGGTHIYMIMERVTPVQESFEDICRAIDASYGTTDEGDEDEENEDDDCTSSDG